MLRVNEKLLRESLSELKQCDQELYNQIEQIGKIRSILNQNSALEEQLVRLSQIISRAETIQYNIKSMSRILDYATFEYSRCENVIVSQCLQTRVKDRNRLRFGKVLFNVPFSDRIEWKKGE